jgi:hypothetical protein
MSGHPHGGALPHHARVPSPWWTSAVRARGRVAWLAAAWGVLLLGGWTLWVAGQPLDPDYTSGELRDHLTAWVDGERLYPPLGAQPPLRVLNYPPLALLVARAFMAGGASPLAAGRLASTAGLVILLAGVAWWVRARGARPPAVAGTLGLLAGSFPLLYASGQFHVEPWASAGMLWGAALLDRARTVGDRPSLPAARRTALLAGGLLALGVFGKQTAVVPVLVILAWSVRHRHAVAPAALAGLLAAGVGGAAILTAVWGLEPWRHLVLYTVGTPELANLGRLLLRYVAPWTVFLVWSGVAIARHRDRSVADLVPVLVVTTALWSLSAVRAGASFGYFLDLHVLVAVWVGPSLFAATGPCWPNGGACSPRITVLLLAQLLAAAVGTTLALGLNVTRRMDQGAAVAATCARVAGTATLFEEAGLARACGMRAWLHPFILASLAQQGRWDPAPVERMLAEGYWQGAVLPFDPRRPVPEPHRDRWSPGMLRAFRTAPVIESLGAGRWLVRWRSP